MPQPSTTSDASRTPVMWKVLSASDGQKIIRAESVTVPHLIIDMDKGFMRVARFDNNVRWRIGRLPGNHLPLEFDKSASGFHAIVIRELDLFRIEDPGPSRNGTYVNGSLVTAARLEDRDVLTCGETEMTVRCPAVLAGTGTVAVARKPDWTVLSPMERATILALLDLWPADRRELEIDPPGATAIAERLDIAPSTVRKHFQNTYKKLGRFGIDNSRPAVANAAAPYERLLRELADSDA